MNDGELIEGLEWCLREARLSGAEWEFCERVVQRGFRKEEPAPGEVGLFGEVTATTELDRARQILRNHGYQP